MMKTFVLNIATAAIILSACGDSNNNSQEANKTADSSATTTPAKNTAANQNASVDQAVTAYLQLKNALTADDGKQAAAAGKQLHDAMMRLDNASFAADQKKLYDEMKDDMKEHAEHISINAEKIAHQREHFDMLSKDMVDFAKAVKPSQTLYKDHCPMYNDKKGADWLSEVKEIKNPYYGKKMIECGEVKEEIRQ